MQFIELNSAGQISEIISKSHNQAIYIFKYSPYCMTSTNIRNNLTIWPYNLIVYRLDCVTLRPLSQQISTEFNIVHQSPQLLKIENGKCTKHSSHGNIQANNI